MIACNNVQHLVEVQPTTKNFEEQIWWKMNQNQAQNYVFCHLLNFGSWDFLEIAYKDSLQQCIKSEPKSGSKIDFLHFSQV